MQVSVRELKNNLSKYLEKVHRGKLIIVTSHSVPVARLSPIPRIANDKLQSLMEMEGVSWNGKKPSGGKNRPSLKGKNASEYVLEDRR